MTEELRDRIDAMEMALLQLRELESLVTHLKEFSRTLDGKVWGDKLKDKLSESADTYVRTACPQLARDNYKVRFSYDRYPYLQLAVNIRGYRGYTVFYSKLYDTYANGIPVENIFTFYKDKKTKKLLRHSDFPFGSEPHDISGCRYFSSEDFIKCFDFGHGGKTAEEYLRIQADILEKGIKTVGKDLTELQETINRYNCLIGSMGILEREILGIRDLSPIYGSALPHLGYKIEF
nr:MAG TPA: hypothetical protein [Caudoviricetes sp.]